jgi:Sulfotransferase family
MTVETAPQPGDRRNAVDILGIGAQKSATSWASHVLNLHPNVWFPREHALSGKEVSFFDGPKWRHGLDWYRRIMTPPDPAFRAADVSPGYSRVGEGRVRACFQVAPDARVFYIMRNPIHRDWSGLQMQAKRRDFDVTTASFVDLMVFYDAENIAQFSTYVGTLQRWRKYYRDQLLVGLYDDVVGDPQRFYRALCAHVGLEPEAVPDWQRRITAKIFQGPGHPLPAPMFEFLSRKYRRMIEELGPLVGRDLGHWLEPQAEPHEAVLAARA